MFDEMTLKIHKLPSFIPMPNYYRWLILILESRVDNIKNLYEHYASPFHNGHRLIIIVTLKVCLKLS